MDLLETIRSHVLGLPDLPKFAIIIVAIVGVSRLAARILLMLGVMAVAGAIADLINLPGIVCAFLAGLAVNGAVHDDPARAKLEFFGKALFILSFFVVTGLLIDPVAFTGSIVDHFPLAIGIIAALLAGKWIAAAAGARTFG